MACVRVQRVKALRGYKGVAAMGGARSGFPIGRLFGIGIVVDWSWLFIFALVTWNLGSSFLFLHPSWDLGLAWMGRARRRQLP
jgi:hypothetical protein